MIRFRVRIVPRSKGGYELLQRKPSGEAVGIRGNVGRGERAERHASGEVIRAVNPRLRLSKVWIVTGGIRRTGVTVIASGNCINQVTAQANFAVALVFEIKGNGRYIETLVDAAVAMTVAIVTMLRIGHTNKHDGKNHRKGQQQNAGCALHVLLLWTV